MDLYRRQGQRRNPHRVRAMSARLVNDLLPASHLSGVPNGFVVWFQQALQVIVSPVRNVLLHSRSARLTDSASGLESFISWSQFYAAAGINKNGNRAKAHKALHSHRGFLSTSRMGETIGAYYMHCNQTGLGGSGDAQLLLHLFERNSLRFRIDQQHNKKLEKHHRREEDERIAAGRRRH
jgi:hypothetical protein